MPDDNHISYLDNKEISSLEKHWENAEFAIARLADKEPEELPEKIDLSKYLHYIRNQYGGCWGYATLAVWDIMNEIVCPYSPNLSFRQWRTFHSKLDLSEQHQGVFSPDGRFHEFYKGGLEWNRKYFTWENVPGGDSGLFREFLKTITGLAWVSDAKIKKTKPMIITATKDSKSLTLTLSKKKTKVTIAINNGGSYVHNVHISNREDGKQVISSTRPTFFQSFGCTTEGTEPTLHGYPCLWPQGGWSREGINEAHNYRLEAEPRKIKVNSNEFMRWLADSHPIRIEGGVHIVAVVGYDRSAQTFKFVNSCGDKWGSAGGYGTFTFDQLNNKQHLWYLGGAITKAYILEKWRFVPPPKPVPAARIAFKHTDRTNVQLWLSVEDSPHPRTKIWSHGWDDYSKNLSITVRLPGEFIWPPTKNNRLILDLHDSALLSNSGGTLEEFTVAFGGHVINCPDLAKGPVSFKAHDYRQFIIP